MINRWFLFSYLCKQYHEDILVSLLSFLSWCIYWRVVHLLMNKTELNTNLPLLYFSWYQSQTVQIRENSDKPFIILIIYPLPAMDESVNETMQNQISWNKWNKCFKCSRNSINQIPQNTYPQSNFLKNWITKITRNWAD